MEKEAKPKPKKPTFVLAGDSILKNIKGWLMSRTKAVKSYSFSGADTDDMKYHLRPIIKRNPHHIVLHCGTNDLAWRTPEEIAMNITGLVKEIKGNNIECSVSAVLKRSDELRHKVIKVNKLLKTALVELDVQFIEHDDINEYHLNKSGLHLNARGDAALACNLIQFIKNLEV